MSLHVGTILNMTPLPEVREGEYYVAPNGGRDLTYELEVDIDGGTPVRFTGVIPQSLPYREFVDVIVPPPGTKVVVFRTAETLTFDVDYVPWHTDCDEGG